MPDYNFTVKIPTNTEESDPERIDLSLTKGLIAGGQIFFPAGCHGLAHVTIHDGRGQLYPANKDDTFHGEDGAIPLVGRHEIDAVPFMLFAQAWNEDDTYDHTIQITLNILTLEEVNLNPIMQRLLDVMTAMKKLLVGRRLSY